MNVFKRYFNITGIQLTKYFTITNIELTERNGVNHLKLMCKKQRFVAIELFDRFVKNLAEKMIDNNRGEGNYTVSWASHDCKWIEAHIYLPLSNGAQRQREYIVGIDLAEGKDQTIYSPPINKLGIVCMDTM